MISQRSVGRLQRLLQTLFYRGPHTIPLLSWSDFRTQLYEQGLDRRLLDHLEWDYGGQPSRFLPALHDGTIPANILRDWAGKPERWDQGKGQELLKVISEVALRRGLSLPAHLPEVIDVAKQLQASLELDGYAFIAEKLVPSVMMGTRISKHAGRSAQLRVRKRQESDRGLPQYRTAHRRGEGGSIEALGFA